MTGARNIGFYPFVAAALPICFERAEASLGQLAGGIERFLAVG
jgi:hypothetical protein